MELSILGSDPEPLEPLPLGQQEYLEPRTAEHRGEEAGVVHVSVWGGGAEIHREESPEVGLGLEKRLALQHPSFTLQSECILYWVFLAVLWEAFCPGIHTSKCW